MVSINNIKTSTKLLGSFSIIGILLILVGVIGYISTKNNNDALSSMYEDNLIPISEVGQIDQLLYSIRGDSYKYLVFTEERNSVQVTINDEISKVNALLEGFRNRELMDTESAALKVFDETWKEYQSALAEAIGYANSNQQESVSATFNSGGRISNARKAIGAAIDELSKISLDEAASLHKQG